MEIATNVAGDVIKSSVISLFATISIVLGCGVVPSRSRNFTVNGFTLPVSMAYSSATDVLARVPGIATSEAGAKGFVERLVKQAVIDVLESQARTALLPDAVISSILSQAYCDSHLHTIDVSESASRSSGPKSARDDGKCLLHLRQHGDGNLLSYGSRW
ncbi:hypothetical protein KIN20_036118 [Parelaphostrongylus tenuis]|uniref:Uncharacterized protein n=1 Tax=Parelaphostrongylus tenuis TaxID=148309 RepID=A0AAD5RCH8_PARTN|nr:hypothetical protein KIN20_036118 [Parelaphostrongylus tenuis]